MFHSLSEYEKTSPELLNLFEEICSQIKVFSSNISNSVLSKEITSKIKLAKQFIENNHHHNVSLKDMSEIACLSEFHFNRYFHKYYGLSPYAYYLVCKMKYSQEILLKQNSVIETAYDLRFFDQSHFTRLFKRHVGVNPGKYLNENRKYHKK